MEELTWQAEPAAAVADKGKPVEVEDRKGQADETARDLKPTDAVRLDISQRTHCQTH